MDSGTIRGLFSIGKYMVGNFEQDDYSSKFNFSYLSPENVLLMLLLEKN